MLAAGFWSELAVSNHVPLVQEVEDKKNCVEIGGFHENRRSIYYIYLEAICPLFWGLNPSKEGRTFNQNKGHLGSRYI